MPTFRPKIEPLESRIAPAAVFVFTDVDGDHVTISVSGSHATNADLAGAVNLSNAAKAAVGFGHELQQLTLGTVFAGGKVSITAKPSTDLTAGTATPTVQGDGFTNVGLIDASTIDLSAVSVAGDLGRILVGDTVTTTKGLGSLVVQSIGKYGTSTQLGTSPNLISRFENGVGSITVRGDVNGAFLHATATGTATTAKIGTVVIKGSLIGGDATDTGEIAAADGIGSVTIAGSIIGGAGMQSGRIGTSADPVSQSPGGSIGKIYVGGDLVGGSNSASGIIDTGTTIGAVTIKGDIIGGSKFQAGVISADLGIASATVLGSIIGGTFGETGGIESQGNLGTIKIAGDLRGSDFSSASSLKHTGFVFALGSITGGVSVGGSLISGLESGGGTLSFSGSIQAGKAIASVTVGGAVTGSAATPVVISGGGAAVKTKTDLAIKSLSVLGNVNYALIQGGYDTTGAAIDGDAQLGAIKVGGDLIASDVVSGVQSTDAYFGNFDKVIAAGNTTSIVSSIASLTVGGQIAGTVDPAVSGPAPTKSVDTFGIEAQLIGSIKTGTVTLPLKAGAGNDDLRLSQTTLHDVHVFELAGT
jgi:hypothetical protein